MPDPAPESLHAKCPECGFAMAGRNCIRESCGYYAPSIDAKDLSALPPEELNRIAAVECRGWHRPALPHPLEGLPRRNPGDWYVDSAGKYWDLNDFDPCHDIRDAKALEFPGIRVTNHPENPKNCRWVVCKKGGIEPCTFAPTEEIARTIAAILAHRAKEGGNA